jgi:gluconate:H+ symporter, GntP family
MYGMPLAQALVFVASVLVLILATQWWTLHPFIVLTVIAAAFGDVAGFTTSQLGSVFGSGFAEKIYSPGLVIVTAGLIAGLAESTTAVATFKAHIERRRWLAGERLAACFGLIAGLAASTASAFALLTPLVPAIGGDPPEERKSIPVALALAISASHGLVWLAPVPIAAAAIIGADWHRVALFGVPLAILLAAFGVIFARWVLPVDAQAEPFQAEPQSDAAKPANGRPIVLLLAIAIPLLLLMVQSIGDMPSEPLGGGPKRELVIGIGRPLILFLVGIGIMVIGQPRQSLRLLADAGWTGRIFSKLASLLLIVGAAGGLQHLCQQTGMAEVLGERLLDWQMGPLLGPFGLMIPFLIAVVIKTLQGSSLVAAITTAGMVQMMLVPLGLSDPNGKALAALAVGAGAMTVSHVNDDYFWLVTTSAGLPPLRGLASLSLGTLLQGLIAIAALLALGSLFSHT